MEQPLLPSADLQALGGGGGDGAGAGEYGAIANGGGGRATRDSTNPQGGQRAGGADGARVAREHTDGSIGAPRSGSGAHGHVRKESTRMSLMDRPAFGEKSITKYGSFILILNNAMGPGLVVLPLVVAESGWFVPTVLFVIINMPVV